MRRIILVLIITCTYSLLPRTLIGQEYDIYLNYSFIGTGNYPRTAQVNIYSNTAIGSPTLFNNEYPDPGFPDAFNILGLSGIRTSTPSVIITGVMDVTILGSSTGDYNSVSLTNTLTTNSFLLSSDNTTFNANLTIRDKMEFSLPSTSQCYRDKINLSATPGHPLESYFWEYSVPSMGVDWTALPNVFQSRSVINVSLIDIIGIDNEEFVGEVIYFRLSNTINNYSVPSLSYSFTHCSTRIIPELTTTTNETCYGANDGTITLTFDSNVENGYEMRYFIYQGNPPFTTTEEELKADPPIFPNQAFADPLGITMVPLNDGSGHYSGTFVGLDGSSAIDNGNTILGNADYYIIYQEVRYDFPNPGDVDVKSGDITPMFTIARPAEIKVTIPTENITQPSCNGDKGSVTLFGQGGGFPPNENIPLEYAIQGDDDSWRSNPTFSNLEPGNYTFLARSSVDCVSSPSEQITIMAPPELSFRDPSPGITTSSTASNGVIGIFYNGGTPNYTFQLSKKNETTLAFETILNPNLVHNHLTKKAEFHNLSVGTYRITIIDSNNCSLTTETLGDMEVTTIPPPTIDSQVITEISCLGDNNGSINIGISGGVPPYNYEWTINGIISQIQSAESQTISLNNLSEVGEYILKIASTGFTEFDGPSGYVSTTITMNQPEDIIIVSVNPNNISCFGAQDGSILVTASGGSSYEYKLDFFDSWKPLNNNTIPINKGGFYDVYIRNQNKCESDPVLGILVLEPDELTVSSTFQSATTNGGNQGSITLSIAGGIPLSEPTDQYSISWTKDGEPFTPSTGSTSTYLGNLEAGEYVAQITDTNGCSPLINPPIIIDQPGPLAITDISVQNEISCSTANDGIINATVTGTSPIIFEWRLNGVPFRTLTDDNSLIDIGPGEYQLFLYDGSLNGPVKSEVITLSPPTDIVGSANITPVSCFGGNDGTMTINAIGGTGNFKYKISGRSTQNSPIFENLLSGTYSITITDENGCTSVPFDVVVPEPTSIKISEVTIDPITVSGRNDGSISLNVEGGSAPYSFEWTGPNGYTNNNQNISNLYPGSYTLVIRDVENQGQIDGCYFTQTFEITQPGALLVNLIQTVMLECNGDNFGEITANVQGGVPPYSYEWFQVTNNNSILTEDTEIIGNLSEGNYFVRVTDANGVSVDALPISITQPKVLEIKGIEVTNVLCEGDTSGAVKVSISGGIGPYSYFWSNGSNTPNLIDMESGEYTLEVYDYNGCFVETTVSINPAPDPVRIIAATTSNVSEYMANDGSISLQIAGGAKPYSLHWIRQSDNMEIGNTQEIKNLSAGSYEVYISDKNGCNLTEIYNISQPDIVEEIITQPSCSDKKNGSITVIVNQGDGTFTYSWNTGATTNTISNLSPGNYTVNINGFGNDTLTRTYVIEEPIPLEINLGDDRTLCAGQELVLNATVDNINASYSWISDNGFSSSDPSITINESGNYSVIVSNQNGCLATDSIFVDISDDVINAEFAVSSQVFVGESLIAVDISYPLPETQHWILPEGATILMQDSDETEMVFDKPGEYEIGIMTQVGKCFAQQTKKVLVMENESLNEGNGTADSRKLIEDFIIYPNPSDGEFTADITLSERGNINIKIFNFANNALMASKKDRGASTYTLPFNISALPSGVYAVVLETPFGNSLRKIIHK